MARQAKRARPPARRTRPGSRAAPASDVRLIGRSRAIVRVREQLHAVAAMHATVLLEGEPGTGKALAARVLHDLSPRRRAPFVAVDCGALPPVVVEAQLFGEAAGGASGAGAFERAEGGTVFLDDIGAASPTTQVRLLRVLQDRTVEPGGGRAPVRVDVRLIVGAHRDLAPEVRAGTFRADLWERLNVVRIALPPLRERREDIPLLIEAFLAGLEHAHARRVTGLTHGARDRLVQHDWPGNVRELRATLEGMAAGLDARRALDLSDLPAALRGRGAASRIEVRVGMTVDEAERQLIAATLAHTGGDKTHAAAMLGIGLRTLYRKIERYRLG